MAPGLEMSIMWATGRLLRRGAANGEQEFTNILKLHSSLESRTAIYRAWVLACRKAQLKAEEAGDVAKSREYTEAEQSVLRQASQKIGASETEKLCQAPQYSQTATMGSGSIHEEQTAAASKQMDCTKQSKRPFECTVEELTAHSCAAAPPHEKRSQPQPLMEIDSSDPNGQRLQGPMVSQPAKPVDSVAVGAPATYPEPAKDHTKTSTPQAHTVVHASIAPVTNVHAEHTHKEHPGLASEPTPTPSAHVVTQPMLKTEYSAPLSGTNAFLPRVPSSARDDGTERSAGVQTTRQGKTPRVPLQERPIIEGTGARQQKVVTFQEPQSSCEVAESSQRQQHVQLVQHTSQTSSKGVVQQHSTSNAPPKETSLSGWDIADPNLCRPKNYRPIKSPKEGDILFVQEAPFKIMYKIGSGASSKVYKVLGPNLRLFALKAVTLKSNSKEVVRGLQEEFDKLRSLKDSPGVINVYSIEEFPEDKMLLMCLELGEIDLAHLLRKKRAEWVARGITDPFIADPTFICGLWHDMLRAVQSIHQHKMVHADLKPANLVIVNGSIKIIDFGISMQCSANTTAIHRSDNTGTINYMSPEAISNTERVGRKSDVWSLGCILYEIAYGRLPFGHIPHLASKVDAIMNCKVTFPHISQGDVLNVLKRCLVRHPDKRADIDELLNHHYLKAVAGGVVTHQVMFNMMAAYSRRLGISEEEVNDHCRQLQEAWNSGQNISADSICKKTLQDKKAASQQREQSAAQPQDRSVLQQQQQNQMRSESASQPQQYAFQGKDATQPPSGRSQHSAENAGDVLDARLMAIRRAHVEADDGNTRTRL